MDAATSEIQRAAPNRTFAHWLVAIAAMGIAIAAAYALGSVNSPKHSGCVQSSAYGTQCVQLTSSGLTVTGIKAEYTTFPDFFGQVAWAFETTTYSCDPRGQTKTECTPEETVYGSLRKANPRITANTMCTREGAATDEQGCSGSLVFSVPRTFRSPRWLCVEVAARVNGKWIDNGPAHSEGNRACREVQ